MKHFGRDTLMGKSASSILRVPGSKKGIKEVSVCKLFRKP